MGREFCSLVPFASWTAILRMNEATYSEKKYAVMSNAKLTGSAAAFWQLSSTNAGQYATTPNATTPKWNIFAGGGRRRNATVKVVAGVWPDRDCMPSTGSDLQHGSGI